MHFRCPYCKADLGTQPQSRCPGCRRAIVVPDHLRAVGFRDRRRARERVHRDLEMAAGGHRRLPALTRSPVQIIVLMVVLALLGGMLILRARQVPRVQTVSTLPERTREELNILRAAVELFANDCGRYPTTAEGLTALISNPDLPGWNGPYVNLIRPDAWGTAFAFASESNVVSLTSAGPDRTFATADDLAPGAWQPLLPTKGL